jgi:hypothetical protein
MVLASNPCQDNAPPITLTFEVPNGTYSVGMRVKPRAAFKAKAQADADFRVVIDDKEPAPGATFSYLDLGQYAVEKGRFCLTLQEASDDRPAALEALLFEPVQHLEGRSVEVDEERTQQLRALGYVE